MKHEPVFVPCVTHRHTDTPHHCGNMQCSSNSSNNNNRRYDAAKHRTRHKRIIFSFNRPPIRLYVPRDHYRHIPPDTHTQVTPKYEFPWEHEHTLARCSTKRCLSHHERKRDGSTPKRDPSAQSGVRKHKTISHTVPE
jgi:hypothetical protein